MNTLHKNLTILLLSWYSVVRWIMLGNGNATSEAWLQNGFGNVIAILSIIYLVYNLCAVNPQKNIYYIFSSIVLFIINLDFLIIMFKDFIALPSQINFGYVMLDIGILAFYTIALKLCYMTKFNKNIESKENIKIA